MTFIIEINKLKGFELVVVIQSFNYLDFSFDPPDFFKEKKNAGSFSVLRTLTLISLLIEIDNLFLPNKILN